MPAKSPEAIARKREHDKAAHALRQKDYRARTSTYFNRERRRMLARNHAKWGLHPDNCILCACDGEADDEHQYRWLQVYDGTRVHTLRPRYGKQSIDIRHMAYWFKALAARIKEETGKTARFYWFSFGYDMQQILLGSDYIDDATVAAIWHQRSRKYGAVRSPDFQQDIAIPCSNLSIYMGRKQVEISFRRTPRDDEDTGIYYVLRFYDVFSMSNKSFVKTTEEYAKYWNDETAKDYLVFVAKGKEARGNFAEYGMDEQAILKYNEMELYLLKRYLDGLIALCLEVQLSPRTLAGPAPLARALMAKYGVVSCLKPMDYDTVEVQESPTLLDALRTVTAGRIENAAQGVIPKGMLHAIDINSAHPSGFAPAPDMGHGYWTRATEDDYQAVERLASPDGSFFHVQTRVPHGKYRYCPLWMRDAQGGITYPEQTNGWYQSVELQAAIRYYPDMDYVLLDGWVWHATGEQDHPFQAMIEETYTERLALKEQKNPAQMILKLSLNSCFGVTLQQSGAYRLVDEQGNTVGYKTPQFSSVYMGSYIPACTRAKLLSILGPYGNHVLSVMTDGVYLDCELPLTFDKTLGGWSTESEEMLTHEYLLLSPGVMLRDDGKHKARGIPNVKSLEYTEVVRAYANEEKTVSIAYQHFQGITESIAQDSAGEWHRSEEAGAFIDAEYRLVVSPLALQSKRDIWGTNETHETYSVYSPPLGSVQMVSARYKRAFDNDTLPELESIIEQDGD